MNTLGKTTGALAVVHLLAAATSASATDVQITSGFMDLGSWTLAGQGLSAEGVFTPSELPSDYLTFIEQPGMSVGMTWASDSFDGWAGQMLLKGVTYNLSGTITPDGGELISFMRLNANPIVLGHASSYMEPFTFSAQFCGYLNAAVSTCVANVDLVGSGTLDLVTSPDPSIPGGLDIRISYGFTGVPEPDSLALLLIGIASLGLTWRQVHRCRDAAAFA